jgi:hypothetical protein
MLVDEDAPPPPPFPVFEFPADPEIFEAPD